MPSEYPELVPLLGEIRDQLKRIAEKLDELSRNEWVIPVEIGEPTVRVRHKLKDGKWE